MLKKDALENVLDGDVKYYVLVKKGRRHYNPQYISVGVTTVQWIFPVPVSNAVGTVDKNSNGIVFIKFGGYGATPECQVIAQNFSERVYGMDFVYRFSPNFSEDSIIYSKSRIAVIVNIKTGEAFHVGYGLSARGYMLGIRFLDPQKNLFVVVKSILIGSIGRERLRWEDYLHIMKLEGQELVDIGWNIHIGERDCISKDFPLYHTWFVHDRKRFVYNRGKILCTDGSQPIPHPFSEVFNANFERIGSIRDIAIHPTLPFGVMIEDYVSFDIFHKLTVVCWEAKKPKNQIAAFSDIFRPLASLFGLKRMVLAYQSISPDGSWYVVGCISPEAAEEVEEPKDPFFIAIPIDSKHPNFLVVEDIVILGQVKNMTSLAWTTAPVSFVVSNGELLHKWDLAELPAARVFVVPKEDGDSSGKKKKKSIFFWKEGR